MPEFYREQVDIREPESDTGERKIPKRLAGTDKAVIFENLEHTLSAEHMEKIWEMIYKRWCYYESLCNMG